MSLVLIGMRGAGKSAAGRLAASQLGVSFADSDALLEKLHGGPITALLAAGETAFRAAESALLLELLPAAGQLLATGGGCILSPRVRGALRQHGQVVWLRAAAPVLAARIAGSNRPSLTGSPITEELAPLLAQREPLYGAVAAHEIHTDTLSVKEVADALQQLWPVPTHHHLR